MGVTKSVQNKAGEIIENCADSFDFEITKNDDNAQNDTDYPMPEKTNAKITGNGTASFGTITFTQTGTYTYKIIEKAGNSEDYEYDTSEYIVTFEVTNPEGLLEVNKTIKKDGFNSDALVFTNKTDKYEPEPDPEPDTPAEPDKPSNPEKPDEPSKQEETTKPEGNEVKNEEKRTEQMPKTGQTRIAYIIIGAVIVASIAGICAITIAISKKGGSSGNNKNNDSTRN